MPKICLRLNELDSHSGESALNRLDVGDGAVHLLSRLGPEQAQALAPLNFFPQLKQPSLSMDGDGEAFFLERRFIVDFPRDA
jgi:hypothetical protein